MNKIIFTPAMTAIAVFALSITLPLAHINASPFIYELDNEFLTTGDFDGDGSLDIALVDRETGRVRIGYSLGGGTFRWTEWRSSGATALSAVTVGKLTDANIDSLAVVCDRDNLGGCPIVPRLDFVLYDR